MSLFEGFKASFNNFLISSRVALWCMVSDDCCCPPCVLITMHRAAGVRSVMKKYPRLKILTSEVHPVAPNHFGQKYFGTDWREKTAAILYPLSAGREFGRGTGQPLQAFTTAAGHRLVFTAIHQRR